VVEIGGGGGVEVDVGEGLFNLGHEGVEGEATAPVGADDGVLGKVLDEGEEFVGRYGAFARVGVADGFGGVGEDREAQGGGGFHEGSHNSMASDIEGLGVRMKFADAFGAEFSASLDFIDGGFAPGGVDGAEGD